MKPIKHHILEKLKINISVNPITFEEILNSKNREDLKNNFNTLRNYLIENYKPLSLIKDNFSNLYYISKNYFNRDNVFIFVGGTTLFIGTADTMYSIYFPKHSRRPILRFEHNRYEENIGFSEFTTNDEELQQYKGVFMLPPELEESFENIKNEAL